MTSWMNGNDLILCLLPLKQGGLGLTSHADTLNTIRTAALQLSESVLYGYDLEETASLKQQLVDFHQLRMEKLVNDLPVDQAIQFVDMNSSISKR